MARKISGPTAKVTETTPANVPTTPVINANGSGTITFDFTENGNSDKCDYAIKNVTTGTWVKVDGSDNGGSEDWQLFADWDNGGQDGRVQVTGLTVYTAYTFQVKARNEADEETALCSASLTMTTNPGLHYGDTSDNLNREITSGNTRVVGTPTVSGRETDESTSASPEYYGALRLSYVLQNNSSTVSRVEVEYSENNSDWYTATAIEIQAAESPNTIAVDVDNGSGLGTLTDEAGTRFINIRAGDKITITSSENSNEGTYTVGTATESVLTMTGVIAGTDNTDDEAMLVTGGDGLITLSTGNATAGDTHQFVWDSYTDSGGSEQDETVYLRIKAYDASPSGGDGSAYGTTAAFKLDNRPATITWINADTFSWGKDDTPEIQAVIPRLRGGVGKGYPRIHFYKDSAGSQLELTLDSILDISNWEYEDSPASWNAFTVNGIPSSAIDDTNKMKVTVPAGSELIDGDKYINGEMGEVQDT
jgi:hypothetical protein